MYYSGKGTTMSLIDLNDFWSQVREETRQGLPPQIWKSTIYWLLPVELDETNNRLVLTTMQSFIREIIETDARINRQLTDSVNRLWRSYYPSSNQAINIIINSAEDMVEDTSSQNTTDTNTASAATMSKNSTGANSATSAAPSNDMYPPMYANNTVEPVMPKTSTVEVTAPHIPKASLVDTATTAPDMPAMESTTNEADEFIGNYEEVAHKLGFKPNPHASSLHPIKPTYEEPVYIEPTGKLRNKMPFIPQESLFPEETDQVAVTDSAYSLDEETETPVYTNSTMGIMNLRTKKSFTKQEENILSASMLNPKYTFENFIAAGATLLPKTIAQSVAKSPGQINPYYIYGQSGMGKTHLMHAIGHEILKHNPSARIMCIPAQKYVEYFTSSLTNNKDVPKDIFHDIDVLLLDDVQAFQNKVGTRADFFHLFNDLILKNKQIVLTCDVLPEDLGDVEERLKTRFAAGMVTTIEPPTPEVLEAILLSKLDNERTSNPDLRMDNSVIRYLAQAYSMGSIRKLEGAFTKLITIADIEHRSHNITVEYALEVLSDILPNNEQPILSINYIQDFIADYFKIKKELLVGQKRNKQYAHPRQIAMFLCRDLINESYPQIALAFGKKDHTTCLHAFNKIEADLKKDQDLVKTIEDIKKKIQENT